MTEIGHNSGGAELKLLVERIERIEAEQKDLSADKKDVYAEGKSRGFDPRTMRKVVAIRKLDKSAFQEMRALEDAYLSAMGLL